jgi:hypothetical protein
VVLMPGDVKRLRVFVASPGDVAEERKRLAKVVDHLRTHVASAYGLDLQLRAFLFLSPTLQPRVALRIAHYR